MNQLEKLDRWIEGHESEMTEFLIKMLQIPSVTGQEGDIQSFMAKTLAENGMVVDVFEPSVEERGSILAFVEPQSSYEGRPDVVGVLRGAGGGRSPAAERAYRCDPGGCCGKLDAWAVVRRRGGWKDLWPRRVRYEVWCCGDDDGAATLQQSGIRLRGDVTAGICDG